MRVFTVYGRESVFVDDAGAVVGDLAGMRPYGSPGLTPPAPIPVYGEPDPVNTP